MKKRFKLQKVLEYRDLMLEREKAQLAALAAEEQRIIRQIKEITGEIHLKQQEMAEAQQMADVALLLLYDKYINRLETDRRGMQQKLLMHRAQMAQQKGQTVTAYRKKSIMDKLSDKHKAAYKAYADKEEVKTSEDIVLTRKAAEINRE